MPGVTLHLCKVIPLILQHNIPWEWFVMFCHVMLCTQYKIQSTHVFNQICYIIFLCYLTRRKYSNDMIDWASKTDRNPTCSRAAPVVWSVCRLYQGRVLLLASSILSLNPPIPVSTSSNFPPLASRQQLAPKHLNVARLQTSVHYLDRKSTRLNSSHL